MLKALSLRQQKKKPLNYVFYKIINGDVNKMPALSYGVNDKDQNIIVTQLPDEGEQETQNTAKNGDIIVSGPANEKYVVKQENLKRTILERLVKAFLLRSLPGWPQSIQDKKK